MASLALLGRVCQLRAVPEAGAVVFAVTYVLLSARRLGALGLDRPAAALLGAVACVALGVLEPEAALEAIDASTLLLLFGVMGIGAFLALDGLFEALEPRALRWASQPARLLGAIVWGAGGLAALVTNDAVCLLAGPLVVRLVLRSQLPGAPFLLALATGANTGSVATLVGNPQNMLCGQLGDLQYLPYLGRAGPIALMGLAINHAVLHLAYRRVLPRRLKTPAALPPRPLERRLLGTLLVIGATAVLSALGAPLAWTAAGGFTVLLLVHRRAAREVWPHIDGTLLLFFAGLFVVAEGLRASGLPDALFARWPLAELASAPNRAAAWTGLAGVFALGSNLVSNVPFILLVRDEVASLPDPEGAWTLLAVASTFAGNLTLLGSAANVIVAEIGRPAGGFGFWTHLRVGLPIAVLTTVAGALWLAL